MASSISRTSLDYEKWFIPKFNYPAFFDACEKGNKVVVQNMIQAEIPLDKKGESGFTALQLACYGGHLEIVELFLHPEVKHKLEDSDLSSALFLLCSAQLNYPIAKRLLEEGANPNQRFSNQGFTPLQIACHYELDALVELLLQFGADPNFHNSDGGNSAHVATKNPRILKLLMEGPLKLDVNAVSLRNNLTLLHSACTYRNIESVRLLLQAGANKEISSKDGETPLQLAWKNCEYEIAEVLMGDIPATNEFAPL